MTHQSGDTLYETHQRQDRQRALENEVLQLFQSLENIEDFLQTSNTTGDYTKTYKLQQYSLQDMQILDLLVQIAMTIDSLRHLDYYQSQHTSVRDIMSIDSTPSLLTCHALN